MVIHDFSCASTVAIYPMDTYVMYASVYEYWFVFFSIGDVPCLCVKHIVYAYGGIFLFTCYKLVFTRLSDNHVAYVLLL